MSELRIETWTVPAAELGPENPLPPLRPGREIHEIDDAPGVPDEMVRNMQYGRIATPLPYTMQDRYDRNRQPRGFRVAVLENETLRAAFFLEMGGRLWSLVHKPSGRELLSRNPVFQPANLAIRNAWFSGGVEWNIGAIGHCPFTCSPLFAARLQAADGTPVLRLYEWERIRGVPFQIDAYLPDGSPVLFVRVRVTNPHAETVPMYWWSNMAVPESEETRVVTPAESAYSFGYKRGSMCVVPIPVADGVDGTYTTRMGRAADFFFHIPDGQRHWIAALDGQGRGLVQTSTPRLQGRKLFFWGMGSGGRTWQTFLSQPGVTYLEIQAGLARTQAEHLPMPPHSEWSWLEAYGLMEADPAAVHGAGWSTAWQTVDGQLEKLLPRGEMEAEFARGADWVDQAPSQVLQLGSGWGALEGERRTAAGEASFASPALAFDAASLGEPQQPWLGLLQTGRFPALDPQAEPTGYVVQPAWRDLLEQSVQAGLSTNWSAWYHLGVMRYHAGARAAAVQAWERSLADRVTPWALRNLAQAAADDGRAEAAADLYVQACRLHPGLTPLAVECGRALIDAGRPQQWLDLLQQLPASVAAAGRIRLLEGQAALATGDFARVEQLFTDKPVVADLREGELSLSELWFDYHARRLSIAQGRAIDDALVARVRQEYPVPPELDFRMST